MTRVPDVSSRRPFSRIAIVNRGEAAMRLIHAVRDLNAQSQAESGEPIQIIALYTEAEHAAMFVREADLAYPLGPAAARPTSTSPRWSAPWSPPARTPRGSAGASSPSTRPSPTCASAWA